MLGLPLFIQIGEITQKVREFGDIYKGKSSTHIFMSMFLNISYILFVAITTMFFFTKGLVLEAKDGTQQDWYDRQWDEHAARREAFFDQYSRRPFPHSGAWLPLGQAQLHYWQERDMEGDREVLQWSKDMEHVDSEIAVTESRDFHWRAFQWARLGLLFGQDGLYRSGAMSLEAELALKEILWEYVRVRATAEIFDPSNDWKLWQSENHHLQAWSSLWASLRLLAADSKFKERILLCGSSVSTAKERIDEYFKRWIRNRAACGLFVESNSPTYTKYSLGGFYNMFDFADDAELRRLARAFLDLFWTQWVIEQVDGVRGGSRHRSYAGRQSILDDSSMDFAWYHFPLPGRPPMHPACYPAITTSYRPPHFISAMVVDRHSLGNWQTVTRLPGVLDPARHRSPNFTSDVEHPFFIQRGVNQLDPATPSILRQTYSTPDFVSGFSMVEPLPMQNWAGISSQNRWDGVIFSGLDAPRVFFQPALLSRGTGSHYNANWSVASKGVAILQRLPRSDAQDQRIFFSSSLIISENNGWVFAESENAYLAIKVVSGGWSWERDNANLWREKSKFQSGLGQWLIVEQTDSPIIFEVASKSDFECKQTFQQLICANALQISNTTVDYTSGYYNTRLTFPRQQQASPEINGKPLDYTNSLPYTGDLLNTGESVTQVIFNLNELRYKFNFNLDE
jgi:hypothetical protein